MPARCPKKFHGLSFGSNTAGPRLFQGESYGKLTVDAPKCWCFGGDLPRHQCHPATGLVISLTVFIATLKFLSN